MQPVLKEIDLMLEQWVSNSSIGGFVATIVVDQEILFTKGYGSSNVFNSSAPPPNIDNFVAIASITKVFTDLMLYELRDAGTVSMDDYVDKYTTNFSVLSTFPSQRRTTLRQLASHTSGLQREVPCYSSDNITIERNPFSCTEAQILANLAQTYLLYPPYNTPHYSNLGISLLGRTLEKAVGQLYEDYVQQHITAPLGLEATFALSPSQQAMLAVGSYMMPNGTVVPAPILDNGWPAPAGGLLATSRDLAKLLSFLFRSVPSNDSSQILDLATVQELLNPIILTRDGQSAWGMPLEFAYNITSPYWSLSKAGQLPGYRSQVALLPALKLGVFVVALNTTVTDDPTLTLRTLPMLEMLTGPLEGWYWQNQPATPLPPNVAQYEGNYSLTTNTAPDGTAGYIQIVRSHDQRSLLVLAPGSNLNLTLYEPNVFRAKLIDPQLTCRWLEDGVNDEFMYFNVTGSAHAWSFVFMGGLYYWLP